MSSNDIVIHVVDQMYDSDWCSEETITNWEEIPENDKTWSKFQQFFKAAYITRMGYIDAKKQR